MYAGSRPSDSSRSISTLASSSGPSGFASSTHPAAEVARFAVRSGKYPHRLNFYERPPLEEITLEEFEVWAIDRLRVLADIESSQARNRTHEETKVIVNARLKSYLPLASDSARGVDIEAERKKDQYSHFVLRLAFCRSEELRMRFLKAETTLFRIRFEMDDVEERKRFVESLNFGWEVVTSEEKATFEQQLRAASHLRGDQRIESEEFFKVHWTKVSDLVERRRVFIHQGQAFVPIKEELSLVLAEFQMRLARGLELTAKALPRLDEDDRLLPILSHLSMGFMAGITSEYTVSTNAEGETMTADMVPELSVKSFPFCMRSIQDELKVSKHLKHEGRQQYGLFLKGIGLSVEEALIFWRKSFSLITDEKFKKEYRYNIRHNFGLEGSRKNYAPKNCQQIITGNSPGAGQVHGCPFKHFNEANLSSALLSTYRLSSVDTKEIVAAAKTGHYHVACTRLFEIQHAAAGVVRGEGLGGGDNVDHPNRYFDGSRKAWRKKEGLEEGVKDEVKPDRMQVDT